jgi:hypothetical protein
VQLLALSSPCLSLLRAVTPRQADAGFEVAVAHTSDPSLGTLVRVRRHLTEGCRRAELASTRAPAPRAGQEGMK